MSLFDLSGKVAVITGGAFGVELSGGVRWDYFDTLFNLYAPPTSVPIA